MKTGHGSISLMAAAHNRPHVTGTRRRGKSLGASENIFWERQCAKPDASLNLVEGPVLRRPRRSRIAGRRKSREFARRRGDAGTPSRDRTSSSPREPGSCPDCRGFQFAAQADAPPGHPGLDPGSMNTDRVGLARPVFMDPDCRQDDAIGDIGKRAWARRGLAGSGVRTCRGFPIGGAIACGPASSRARPGIHEHGSCRPGSARVHGS